MQKLGDWKRIKESSDVYDLVKKMNRGFVSAVLVLMLSLTVFADWSPIYASESQGFLIVTREMFVDSLDEFVQWKTSRGFEVHVVTAEWIQDNVAGDDLRLKIRNCIRDYYYSQDVKFAMLVGDSVDVLAEFNETQPAPVLSEDWNLPAGYYWWDSLGGAQYTTLFYSDLLDKVNYTETEYYYTGDFGVYVGVVPVRTTGELRTVLAKTMLVPYYTYPNITYVNSEDLYNTVVQDKFDYVETLAGSNVSTDFSVYGTNSSSEEIGEKLFERKGTLFAHGHGTYGSWFTIGGTVITNGNASDFQFINPLFMVSSCLSYLYHLDISAIFGSPYLECIDEAFLKAQKGPGVVITGEPWGDKPSGVLFSDQELGFWQDLLGGKTVGEAFVGHCGRAWQNPIFLFGDPSLVVIGEPEVDDAPPDITDVSQSPSAENVLTEDTVKVNATVADELSGVKRVTLNYTVGDGAWFAVDMTHLQGDVWNATIPALPYDTSVTYRVVAEDNMENTISTEELGYDNQYTVVPEFSTCTTLLLLMVAAALVIVSYQRKRS